MDVHHVTENAESFTCNAFLVTGDKRALIDVGTMNGVVDVVREYTEGVDTVALTHQHTDHVGQLDAVCNAFTPEVYAYADNPQRTHELEDGDTIMLGDEEFDVVYTPGHAPDHVSFVSETTLFSGDVVVHDDGAFEYGSFGRTDIAGADREILIESIERLLDRLPSGVNNLYAGHGNVFHGDVRDVVKTALSRAKKREPKYSKG